jgi:hypothetical protein
MRSDLETAMGVALTCRSACAVLLENPLEYSDVFGLDNDEITTLTTMAADLAALMPGFVVKREKTLRRSLRLTLSLLGDEATAYVEEYSDEVPGHEKLMGDMIGFAEFVIEKAQAAGSSLAYGQIIVDVARFERLRLQCFGTGGALSISSPAPVPESKEFHHLGPLELHPSAVFDRFGWDLRSVRGRRDLARMHEDPCFMVFFQWGNDGAIRTLRLDDVTSRAVEFLGQQPGALSAGELCRAVGTDRSPLALLGKLVRQGALRTSQ